LNDKWKRIETAIRKVAEKTIGYSRRQVRSKWFNEECGVVNDEKNTLARSRQRYLFSREKRQLKEEASIEVERFRTIQELRQFDKQLNDVR
jgi:hypothetical protein